MTHNEKEALRAVAETPCVSRNGNLFLSLRGSEYVTVTRTDTGDGILYRYTVSDSGLAALHTS